MTESQAHRKLKKKAVNWLKEQGFENDEIELEYSIGDYRVDVVALGDNETVAVECGYLSGNTDYKNKKVDFLEQQFDRYKRFSYMQVKESRRSKEKVKPGAEIIKENSKLYVKACKQNITKRRADSKGRISLPVSQYKNKEVEVIVTEVEK